jgi:hypothetical protein
MPSDREAVVTDVADVGPTPLGDRRADARDASRTTDTAIERCACDP